MSKVAAIERGTRSASHDPAIAAIKDYWAAIEIWRAADRRVRRLRKRLPEDLMREPRVQVASLLRGRDGAGADIKEPIYAHSEWQIRDHIQRECNTMVSIHASPKWMWGRLSKERKAADVKARRGIRAKYRKKLKDKIAAFLADKEALYARQRDAGWRQAVEAAERARWQVVNLRYKAQKVKPSTTAGAVALVQFIGEAEQSAMNSNNQDAPYGLGRSYSAGIARRAAEFLAARRTA